MTVVAWTVASKYGHFVMPKYSSPWNFTIYLGRVFNVPEVN
jgi:hypothetical protein